MLTIYPNSWGLDISNARIAKAAWEVVRISRRLTRVKRLDTPGTCACLAQFLFPVVVFSSMCIYSWRN